MSAHAPEQIVATRLAARHTGMTLVHNKRRFVIESIVRNGGHIVITTKHSAKPIILAPLDEIGVEP